MERSLDMLAYMVSVGAKPLPYMFAGAVAGLLFEHLEAFPDGGIAFGLTTLVSSGIALTVLPPLLWVKRWADGRSRDDVAFWPSSCITGTAFLILWTVLWVRLGLPG